MGIGRGCRVCLSQGAFVEDYGTANPYSLSSFLFRDIGQVQGTNKVADVGLTRLRKPYITSNLGLQRFQSSAKDS